MGRTSAGRFGWGGGYAPGAPSVQTILGSGSGTWAAIQQKRAVYHNGYTYVGVIDSSGNIKVVIYTNVTRAVTSVNAKTGFTVDDHNNPALLVEANTHKLWVAYSDHNGSEMYLRRSTASLDSDPLISGGFATEQTLHSQLASWAAYTYPILLQLTGETDDPVYLFWRERHAGVGVDRLRFSTSTDGTTWAASEPIAVAKGSTQSSTYWGIVTNGTDRYDVFFTDYSDGTTSKLSHFYYTGGTYYKSDGTSIVSAATIASDNANAFTYSSMTTVLANTNGAADRAFGVAWDATSSTGAALAWQKNGTTTRRVVSCRYRSSAWQTDTVVNDVGGFLAGNEYQSGADMHPTDPDTVLVPKKVSGTFEMFRYTSADDGDTWTEQQLTANSDHDNFNPAFVHSGASPLQAVWPYGDFTDDTTWSIGLRGCSP